MRGQSASKKNSPASVMGAPMSSAPWRVTSVVALDQYRIEVRFADGLHGVADLSALIHSPAAGVFAALQDEALFASVLVDHGAVAWPNGLDLAPDAMHRAIRATGCFMPGTERAA
jgi:hypothetical protein